MALFSKKPQQSENLEELRDITDDVIEADFVPYACHWDPHTLVTKNGELLQTIKITGFTHEQLEHEDDSDLRTKIREAITQCIDDTHYAIWIHTIRRKKSLQSGGEFKRDFAGYLNRFWNDRNDWEHQFTNEVYITIVHEGQGASIFDPAGFVRGILPRFDIRFRERFLAAARDRLNAVVERMLPVLDRYGAHRLGLVKRGDIYYSEPSSFLGKLVTMIDFDFPVTDVDISHQLTDYDVTFGFNAMEVRMREDGKRRFGTILTMKEYRELPVEALDRLLHIPAEFIISQCFTFISTKRALADYAYQKELFDLSKSDLLAEKTGLTNILASDTGSVTDYGEHQLNIFLLADSLRAMENGLVKAVGALTSLGMIPMREDIKLEECYWAQLPANFEFVQRMRPINTSNLAGFANLSNFPAGEKDGMHWGPAVTTFYTAAHTPYFFSFHEGDNGHTSIIGPYGAGKTVLMNFLLSQAQKFDGKMFFFDTGRSSEIFLRSLDGTYVNPYPGADPRPYAKVALNPLALDDTPANRAFLSGWLMELAGAGDDKALLAACDAALGALMKTPKAGRRLSAVVQTLAVTDAAFAQRFAPWIEGGEFAALFDAGGEPFAFTSKVAGFEMNDVIGHKPTIVPVLSYLLHRVMLELDGSPTIIVIDEAWALLDHPYFSTRLREWMDMLRSKNAMVIFATEHVEQARGSSINASLLDRVPTQIYLPDEGADASYAEAFGLTEKEISYLTVMNTEDRHFLLKRSKNTIVAELNLSGMADIVAVLSATGPHLIAMDAAIAAGGLQPAQWMPKFLEKI